MHHETHHEHIHSTMPPINWVSSFFYRYRRDVLGIDEVNAQADMEVETQRASGPNLNFTPQIGPAGAVLEPSGLLLLALPLGLVILLATRRGSFSVSRHVRNLTSTTSPAV